MRRFVADLRVLSCICLLSVAFGPDIGAAEPWDKPPAEWSQGDIERLLANSPWSQQVSATVVDPYEAVEPQRQGPLPGAHEAGIAGPSTGPRWDGGPGHNRRGRLPTVPVMVRWESALPIREALRLSEAAPASPAAPEAAYVIEVVGLVQKGKYHAAGTPETVGVSGSGGETRSADAGNPEEVLEAFMSYSSLRVSGGAAIRPDNVKLDPATGAVHIYFPRGRGFDRHQKEVQFFTHFGSLNLQMKFRLSGMTYRGQIEL